MRRRQRDWNEVQQGRDAQRDLSDRCEGYAVCPALRVAHDIGSASEEGNREEDSECGHRLLSAQPHK
jgi:hypothetical protein